LWQFCGGASSAAARHALVKFATAAIRVRGRYWGYTAIGYLPLQ
jgi:hypothetical protein